ncbi:HNH endonuclease [Miniphocaeibacter massiliensis]|uniref:HNH endonuclease n=1 Tax=Miniphocaeibacter massiliensis TaxID=2041841 RepID=UPI000C1C7637|nr:HNH endonuclease [Miniphocaeibacter massiliensis]
MSNNYKSKRWIKTRECVLRRDDYLCKQCSRYGKIKQADTVHHIYIADMFPFLFWNKLNLISLCKDCHNKMHNRTTGELTKLGLEWTERIKNKISPYLTGTKLT